MENKTANTTENKERFLKICREEINRPGLENLIEWLEKSDFFQAPASSKFHGNYVGGLCEHSLNVYDVAIHLRDTYAPDAITTESIAVAALFHDICKVHYYKKGFRNVKNNDSGQWEKKEIWEIEERLPLGHGEKSCIILQWFIRPTVDELLAIRWHMSGFDKSVIGGDYSVSKAQDYTPLCGLIQAADMVASNLVERDS
ncbi:MAG: hydrolase [Ruminococcaceae bacterium]|nr:hydrolase [Oscillospiraceae bacterium]